ncbi:peptidylprolyl isomerase [Lysobacter sp. H21R4]|uniref:FKBP-type peptidyl-prolyl cis-trans isomerase n=1 Tax=Lysobacter sp. H21R4 TaxID=2781021 RepID=UPI0018873777|nr:peptidylprolyl isomerase [Lysobacter sp. H21R4]QOY61702.1 peptidylprolyl isomerase [Lysobacter sp. H21R4]
MEIADRRVATVHYTLQLDDGTQVHSSYSAQPLVYLHGAGKLMPGLEKALAGKKVGDRLKAVVPPEEGYGPRHEQLVQTVPLSAFEDVDMVKPGAKFLTETAQGPVLATVLTVDGDRIKVDGNHELSGKTLHFDLRVVDVREATLGELTQGDVIGD